MSIKSVIQSIFGSSNIASATVSDTINLWRSKAASIQLDWTNNDPAADNFLAGVANVDTATFDTKANTTTGDYLVVGDSNGDSWAVAASTEGISEVTDMTCVGDITAVAEVTSITAKSPQETVQITAVADVADSLDKKYFILQDEVGSVGFWYDVDDSGTQVDPVLVSLTDRQVEITTVATGDDAATVGTKTFTAITGDSKFEAGTDNLDGSFTVVSTTPGVRNAPNVGNSGFAMLVTVAGAALELDGTYFTLQDTDGSVAFWIDQDDSGTTIPAGASAADRAVEITTIASTDSASDIGGKLRAAINADSKFSTAGSGATCTVTNADAEALPDAADGDTGFIFVTDTQGVTAALLDGTYFLLQDIAGSVAFWIDTDDSGTTIPAGASAADRAVEITTVTSGMTASQVAGVVATAINGDSKFAASAASEVVTITNADKKDLTDPADGDTGFTFNVTTQGSDLGLAPTGAIWAAIPSANKTQVDLVSATTAADVAAAFEVAFDGLTGLSAVITTDDSVADGTMTFTNGTVGVVATPQVKNADDSGAGSISAVETTAGVATDVNITSNAITLTGHAYDTGLKGQLTTTDTLPSGLALTTDYFVIKIDANTIKLASSLSNALAGTAIDITDVGVGTHTFTPTALASATWTPQASNDGTTWYNLASAANITATGGVLLNLNDIDSSDLGYRYVRVSIAISAGSLAIVGTACIKEE